MKKTSLVLVLPLLLTVVSPALALETNANLRLDIKNKRAEIKTEVKENREENKSLRATGVQNRQDSRHANAVAIVKRLRQGMVNRHDVILKQKALVEARITKIEAANNTTPTPTKIRDLTAAKAKLATFSDVKYQSDLADFDTKSAVVLSSTTPLKLTAELKASAKNVDADLRSMRQVLADTLRLIIRVR